MYNLYNSTRLGEINSRGWVTFIQNSVQIPRRVFHWYRGVRSLMRALGTGIITAPARNIGSLFYMGKRELNSRRVEIGYFLK